MSALIIKGGVLPTPSVLLRHAGELNLTPQELMLVLYILDKKWGSDWPYVSMLQAAADLGRHKNKVYHWKRSLVHKGYLRATQRIVPGIGRRADYCDLSGLFAALERFVLQETVEEARAELPVPMYDTGKLTTVSAGRSTLIGAPRSTENGAPRRTRIGASRSDDIGATRHDENGARNRAPPKTTAASSRDTNVTLQNPEEVSGSASRPTQPASEIVQRIKQYARELRDNDAERSIERAHHVWWSSGLSRAAFVGFLELARARAREEISKGNVKKGKPGQRQAMPYFFAILQDLVDRETKVAKDAG